MSTREQLEQVNAAINAIESGAQEYQIGSRRITKPDLSVLYKERERLELKLKQETESGIFVAVFDRR